MSRRKSVKNIGIAVITFQYPPIGGGYSERMTGFIKQWVRGGLSVHVVTAEPTGLGLPLDPESENEVQGVASVTRLPTLQGRWSWGMLGENGRFSSAWRGVNRIVPIDAHLPWALAAARVVERLYREGKIDVVLTTSTPYSVHMAGLWLRKRCPGLAWVADFRDPWTTNYQEARVRRFPFSRWLNKRIEQSIYDTADRVVINTDRNLEEVREHFRLPEVKACVIQNGFDPDIPIQGDSCWSREAGRFRLGYVGGFRGDWFEGPILKGLSKLKELAPSEYERLDVLLVGSDRITSVLKDTLGVSDCLHPCGFHPRLSLGGWFSSMDALLLVLPDNKGRLLGWVPQRVYLYFATGLPIFAVVPDGEVARYIRETGSGVVLPPTDPNIIATTLKEWIDKGPPSLVDRSPESVKQFSKVVLAERFCSVFEDACCRNGRIVSREKG